MEKQTSRLARLAMEKETSKASKVGYGEGNFKASKVGYGEGNFKASKVGYGDLAIICRIRELSLQGEKLSADLLPLIGFNKKLQEAMEQEGITLEKLLLLSVMEVDSTTRCCHTPASNSEQA